MEDLKKLKDLIREDVMPMLSDTFLQSLLEDSDTFNEAVYKAAIFKSENTSLVVSGMSLQDQSKYFLRIASLYRPSNTGIVRGD